MSELISIEADRIALRIVAGINDVVTEDDSEQIRVLIADVFGPGAPPHGQIMLALARRLLTHYEMLFGAEAVGSMLSIELARLAAEAEKGGDDSE